MSHLYGEDGVSSPVTFVKLYDNCVIDLKVNADKDFDDLTLAFEKLKMLKSLIKHKLVFSTKNQSLCTSKSSNAA